MLVESQQIQFFLKSIQSLKETKGGSMEIYCTRAPTYRIHCSRTLPARALLSVWWLFLWLHGDDPGDLLFHSPALSVQAQSQICEGTWAGEMVEFRNVHYSCMKALCWYKLYGSAKGCLVSFLHFMLRLQSGSFYLSIMSQASVFENVTLSASNCPWNHNSLSPV